MKLEDLQANVAVRGVLPESLVTVVNVQWYGDNALELTSKDPAGRVSNEVLYRSDEGRLKVAKKGKPWSFDGDGKLFRLVAEPLRDLLIKAIRYGEQPEARAYLTTVVDQAMDREKLQRLIEDKVLEQDGDFDADSRWAVAWFEPHGFAEGEFGVADVLARAKNTSVPGILKSSRGDVRLLKPSELAADWDPATDTRLSAWEGVHQLIRALESGGESAAAELVAKLGSKAELARELCYRFYTLCERKKRAAEALSYNALVQSFPELERLVKEPGRKASAQASMLVEGEE